MERLALLVLAITGAPLLWRTVRGMLRGHFASDVVASLAIVAAIALRQPLAGLVVVLMQTGGEMLERYAARRATRVLDELEEARPHVAHRISGDEIMDVSVDVVRAMDLLIVRPGELVPADGIVESGESVVDASRITGESMPVEVAPGAKLLSGTINGDRPLTLRATAAAAESQYARIVDLVRSAQASKAPLQRIADRYAVWFTPLTIALCAITYGISHDWLRVLAVLVVATPCPLILATPVAMVGGISHAARHGIIVRHGGALEALSRVTVAVLDKTGTLTLGRPDVAKVHAAPGWHSETVIRLAAAVEQSSAHALARSVVAEAERRNGALPPTESIAETPGRGVSGTVARHRIVVGSRSFALDTSRVDPVDVTELERQSPDSTLRAFVVVDDVAAGMIDFADRLRDNARSTLRRLRALGVHRTMLLSGDRQQYVDTIAREAGIAEARGDLLPEDKVNAVVQLSQSGEQVLMVGDGVNDAPALSQAAVGIALAAHGRGIASESADVILLDDDVAGVAEAVAIGRKTMRVARQSIVVGLGLSAVAMVFAAAGMIAPVAGAALQEAIDVAVILNALRTSR